MSSHFLVDDVYEVMAIDPDGKKFDRVSRIQGKSENYDTKLLLDINIEVYPVRVGEKYAFVLTKSLSLDGSPLDAADAWRPNNIKTNLADKYEYVMYGRIFKLEEISSSKMYCLVLNLNLSLISLRAIYVSYGGLLMRLEGDPRQFADITIGSNIYLLMRKI